jgi:dephospho-CoA kinase
MLRVGVAGPAGSGKSTLAARLGERGFPVLDADAIAHELYAAGTELARAIVEAFGPRVRAADGGIDRRALGDEVFGRPARLAALNAIVHPGLVAEIERRLAALEASGAAAAIVDAALLLQWDAALAIDLLVGVTARRDERARRLVANGLDSAAADRRLDLQVSEEALARRADLLVVNDGGPEDLRREADRIAAEIRRRAGLPPSPERTP